MSHSSVFSESPTALEDVSTDNSMYWQGNDLSCATSLLRHNTDPFISSTFPA